ncbi:hypothetical protein [Methylorubrum extorquens]|uniref:Uncharacterized protein n=1 Tax=Methylorubrum extorquens (strain CM4 / NCIMB 13688) TaxID=440085 RepID=B7L371_METC4|nr:hypothetical protein [Methylorubrum extorquens]ACK86279.1 hypothetical protein Mchl_5543 [Methylorubrum extorquens CM4]
MLDFLGRFGAWAVELGWIDLELFGAGYKLDVDIAINVCSLIGKGTNDPDNAEGRQR